MSVHRIYTGNTVTAEIKPLTSGGINRLVVSVSTGIVEDASADGTNRALTELTRIHAEIGDAINALMAKRAEIEKFRGEGG